MRMFSYYLWIRDIVFAELLFSFFGRNAFLYCLKFIQTSYAILYKSMTENDCM